MTRRWIHTLAIATLGLTLVLITWGGLVHTTGSSLACPDWPLCYGKVFPEMKGSIAVEHGHRLLASLVGMLTVIIAISLWRDPSVKVYPKLRRRLVTLGMAALVLVLFQGILGGITVIYKLPLAISSAHLATSMVFAVIMLAIAFFTRTPNKTAAVSLPVKATTPWVGLTALTILVQIVIGALVRHTGSGLACGTDIVRCAGIWWPAWGPAQLHMLHRLGAAVVFVGVTATAGRVWWLSRIDPAQTKLRLIARIQFALVITQGLLGMLNILSYLAMTSVTAHLAIGALLLCNTSLFYLVLRASIPQANTLSSLMTPSTVKVPA